MIQSELRHVARRCHAGLSCVRALFSFLTFWDVTDDIAGIFWTIRVFRQEPLIALSKRVGNGEMNHFDVSELLDRLIYDFPPNLIDDLKGFV